MSIDVPEYSIIIASGLDFIGNTLKRCDKSMEVTCNDSPVDKLDASVPPSSESKESSAQVNDDVDQDEDEIECNLVGWEARYGEVVWAKYHSHPYWPALILDPMWIDIAQYLSDFFKIKYPQNAPDTSSSTSKSGRFSLSNDILATLQNVESCHRKATGECLGIKYLVCFYGEDSIGFVPPKFIRPFNLDLMNQLIPDKRTTTTKAFNQSVSQAKAEMLIEDPRQRGKSYVDKLVQHVGHLLAYILHNLNLNQDKAEFVVQAIVQTIVNKKLDISSYIQTLLNKIKV